MRSSLLKPLFLILFIVLFITPVHSKAGIYKCRDADGNTTFSDQPCANDSDESVLEQHNENTTKTNSDLSGINSANQSQDTPNVSMSELQGKWVITSVNGEDDGDRSDVWEFRGNKWIVWMQTTDLPADPFSVSGNIIDLDYVQIEILEFSGNSMKTKQFSFIYTFEKLP